MTCVATKSLATRSWEQFTSLSEGVQIAAMIGGTVIAVAAIVGFILFIKIFGR